MLNEFLGGKNKKICQHSEMFLFLSSVGYCASKTSASNDVCHMEPVRTGTIDIQLNLLESSCCLFGSVDLLMQLSTK